MLPHRGQGNRPHAWPHGNVPWGGPQSSGATHGSIKNPPPWAPELEQSYPFRHWLMDCITWVHSTDIDEVRKGPQIELALGGLARDYVREIPLPTKLHGGVIDIGDGNGPRQCPGAVLILNALATRFMPLEEEVSMRALADLYGFARLHGEPVDQLLTRWEIILERANTKAGITMSHQHAAWMLLLALKIPMDYWIHLLTPFRGSLPTNAEDYRIFLGCIKRFGH